jgi:GT2 family glycosyltransferase
LQDLGSMVDVSIIVVSFNTRDLTLDCIKSIGKEGSFLKKEIIVVDNNSSDGSVAALQRLRKSLPRRQAGKYPKLQLIINKKNLGFAKANNQGIKKAKGRYILLLNSDTKVKKEALKKLVSFARKTSGVGVVAPRLINPDGSIQGSVFRFPTMHRAIKQYWMGKRKILDKYAPFGNEPQEVEAAVMAAFMIAPKALKKVGFLDERYFMYFEDLDYCRRVHRAVLKVYYLPEAEVVHYHGKSGKGTGDIQRKRLIKSSKIYHGSFKHYFLNFIIWSGHKWRRLFH